ncbi:MAG: hypothetical protein RL095_1370 [Verrucomicrobiota bacterium]|jgi:threonine/homoserine/homoserine lactone efflux protein
MSLPPAESLAIFLSIALLHGVALISPGPDFFLVLRESLGRGLRAGRLAALGIGAGLSLHLLLALCGYGLLLQSHPELQGGLQGIGVAYLLWIAFQSLRAALKPAAETPSDEAPATAESDGSFRRGLLTNLLNPKVTLFFFCVYSSCLPSQAGNGLKATCALWMVSSSVLWFFAVAQISQRMRPALTRPVARRVLDAAAALAFGGIAMKLLLS